MKVGDLVKLEGEVDSTLVGVITHIDPEEIGDPEEVLVLWSDGDLGNHSMWRLEVINASR
jgi:hypothetical protein